MIETADQLVHATAADNQIRCLAAITTNLVADACRRHRTFPTCSVALGRTLTGGLLLGSSVKDLEKITVRFQCDGPVRGITVQADPHGRVRGYVANPEADITEMNELGKFDVRRVVGGGTMYVTRDAGFEIGLMKEPYYGTVPIVSGEIGEDFAYYLSKSEQINSAVGLGVLMAVDPENSSEEPATEMEVEPEFSLDRLRVAAAGGYIIQMMPDAETGLIARLEKSIAAAPSSTEMIKSGLSAIEMLRMALGDMDLNVLTEIEPRFHCQCSHERALLIVSALGPPEIQDMIQKDKGAELVCHFCNNRYQITEQELAAMLAA